MMQLKQQLKQYEVVDQEALRDALRERQIQECSIVRVAEDGEFFVGGEGGGHNSLGGARGGYIPKSEEVERVSVPMRDQAYNWWYEYLVTPAVDGLEVVDWGERWGDWSPNYFYRRRYVLKRRDGRWGLEEIQTVKEMT